MFKKILLVVAILFGIVACQNLPVIRQLPPLTTTLVLQVGEGQIDESNNIRNSLLIVEPIQAEKWRFIQVNSLGMPLARKVLDDGHWKNDGFLPPNAQSSTLFTVVYAYILHKNHQSLPDGFNHITFEAQNNGATKIIWREKLWVLKEIDNE